MELINLELEFTTKKFNPQINFLIHENPTWNINYLEQVFELGTWNSYSEYLTHDKKQQAKNGIGINKFGIGIDKFDVELESTKWN